MNIEQTQKRVAELCGFTDIRLSTRWEVTDPPDDPVVLLGIRRGEKEKLPWYPEDASACAEFEMQMPAEEFDLYIEFLRAEVADLGGRVKCVSLRGPELREVFKASPRKRCLAFIKMKEQRHSSEKPTQTINPA